jgi:hypothetical protein
MDRNVSAVDVRQGSLGTDAPSLDDRKSVNFQGFARTSSMPEEGLEPPTRGL